MKSTMKKANIVLSTGLVLLSTSMVTLAETKHTLLTWEASAELGFVKTAGNSDTETTNAKFDGSTAYNSWKHALHLETLNSSSSSVRSAEKYLVSAQSDRNLDDRSYLLGIATWEKDLFDGFDYQASFALGYGYKVIKEEDMTLSLEIAPGYRISEFNAGNNEEDGILRLAETFSWNVSETSTFDQFFNTEAGDSNTISRLGVALTSQVANALSMKVGYTIKKNSDVPVGTEKTDRETSITLVYKL